MKHRAVFSCRSPAAGAIFRSISPELQDINPRSEVRVSQEDAETLVISVSAEDIPALRAALNLWLRLISVSEEMLEISGDGSPGFGDDRNHPGARDRSDLPRVSRAGDRAGRRGEAPEEKDPKVKGREPPSRLPETTMVVHGPEAFDRGDVARLMEILTPGRTVVAGVMARTAAEESGLPVTFDGDPPSSVLRRIPGKAFLVNRGKTPESGRIFGEMVASRLAPDLPLVQVECSSGTVYLWNGRDRGFARILADKTGFSLEELTAEPAGGGPHREIRGCIPGEPVLVQGIVIGTALADRVIIEAKGSRIEAVSGLRPKAHGLEKLARMGVMDLSTAWCKSGPVRRVPPRRGGPTRATGRILVVDHCGQNLYRTLAPDTCGVLAIGDDTTAVCGHICAHRGIPVFGVVDGDLDGLLEADFAPGSVVVEVLAGRDDDLGRELALAVGDGAITWGEWVERALRVLADRCRVIHPPER